MWDRLDDAHVWMLNVKTWTVQTKKYIRTQCFPTLVWPKCTHASTHRHIDLQTCVMRCKSSKTPQSNEMDWPLRWTWAANECTRSPPFFDWTSLFEAHGSILSIQGANRLDYSSITKITHISCRPTLALTPPSYPTPPTSKRKTSWSDVSPWQTCLQAELQ